MLRTCTPTMKRYPVFRAYTERKTNIEWKILANHLFRSSLSKRPNKKNIETYIFLTAQIALYDCVWYKEHTVTISLNKKNTKNTFFTWMDIVLLMVCVFFFLLGCGSQSYYDNVCPGGFCFLTHHSAHQYPINTGHSMQRINNIRLRTVPCLSICCRWTIFIKSTVERLNTARPGGFGAP